MKTVKLASAGYLDHLPTSGNKLGQAFRDLEWEEKVMDVAFENGLVLYPGTGFVDRVNGDLAMVGPPLIIEESQIDELIEILKRTFSQVEQEVK
jgi:adenosylmethionine-8-amino-7-oxononanoate aminotransferase